MGWCLWSALNDILMGGDKHFHSNHQRVVLQQLCLKGENKFNLVSPSHLCNCFVPDFSSLQDTFFQIINSRTLYQKSCKNIFGFPSYNKVATLYEFLFQDYTMRRIHYRHLAATRISFESFFGMIDILKEKIYSTDCYIFLPYGKIGN